MNPKTEARLRADFRAFLTYVWRFLGLPKPTYIQLDIAHYLQHTSNPLSKDDRIIIEAFRGIGKSWITSAFVCWLLWNNPELKILVVSASKERADAFSTFTKRLINEVPILAVLKPKEGGRDSNIAFDVGPANAAHAPSVKSVGITGQMAGSRANVIIADDVEIPKNSMTQVQRDKLAEAVKEFDAILNPGGRIIYLGTPQCEMSLYNVLLTRGYKCRIWPVRYPTAKQAEKYGDNLAPWIKAQIAQDKSLIGQSTEPTRFPEEELGKREASYGRSGFALQFMLDTSLSDTDRYPLKLSDFIVFDCDPVKAPVHLAWASSPDYISQDVPFVGFTGDRYHRPMLISSDWLDYEGSVRAIDPSGRGADETGYAVTKMLKGLLYLVDVGGLKGGYDEATLTALAETAKRHKVNQVIIESNFGDGMFTALFKPILSRYWNVTVEEVHHNIQKEKRIIDVLEPIMNQHRLILNKSIINADFRSSDVPAFQFLYQLTRITRDRGALAHDDRVDPVAMAVAYWVDYLSNDTKKAEQEEKERMTEENLQRFMEHIVFPVGMTDGADREGHQNCLGFSRG